MSKTKEEVRQYNLGYGRGQRSRKENGSKGIKLNQEQIKSLVLLRDACNVILGG